MYTEQILKADRAKLKQVNEAIKVLSPDKRPKTQALLEKFRELRENLMISIESNETALKLEHEFAGAVQEGQIIVFAQ